MTIQEIIKQEKETARKKYGAFNSTHEGYAVLKEEVEEFWDEVKTRYSEPITRVRMISELIQIAAVAQRIAEELENNQIKHV